MLPNDRVSMSVGHLDQVLTVYSSMEHVTLKLVVHLKDKVKDEEKTDLIYRALQELLQLIHWRDRQKVWSEDQGAQERSGLFHSWYTDPRLQSKEEQCNS